MALASALPRALSSCSRANAGAITGRVIGPSARRGHILRDGAPSMSVAKRADTSVAILGGGVAGLSAAWKLARSGFTDFTLYELEDEVGGTSVGGENRVSRFPWGAHYIPVPTREQRALCQLLEEMRVIRGMDADGRALAAPEHLVRAPQERLFFAGAWMEGLYCVDGASRDDLAQLDRFEKKVAELAARRDAAGKRWFAIPVDTSSNDPEPRALDRQSMAQWLAAQGFDSPRLRWYVEYACRDDFGCLLEQTSAWAGLHYFCSRIAKSGDEPAEFLTWPDGNAFVVRHLARSAQGRVRPGCVALGIEPRPDHALVRVLDTRANELVAVRAKRVICALPRFVTRRLLSELAAEPDVFHHSPWVVANLTLRSRPEERGYPIAWDNVLFESHSLGYVVATHQTDRTDTSSVWTWYQPFCASDVRAARAEIQSKRWEHWRDAVLRDLGRAHPDLEACVETLDAWVWGHAMVRPEPGFVWSDARANAARPRGNVHFAGTDLGGMALFEEAQWSGVRAAEEVLASLGASFESSL
jgi:glycine/D-amino acid oxidase-like deaminating enzyme